MTISSRRCSTRLAVRGKRAKTRPARGESARRKISEAADRLFGRLGIRNVGVDAIVAESGVAKMTLYRHFPAKEDLAVTFLQRISTLFARPWPEDVRRRSRTPKGRLLAVFDALDDWFRRKDYAGCPVIKALLEDDDPRSPVRRQTLGYFDELRDFIRQLA